jgi:hypothetical protein
MEWLDDEDEIYLETLELLKEAREDVDRKYPRVGDNQLNHIMRLGVLERWCETHFIMNRIERYLKD